MTDGERDAGRALANLVAEGAGADACARASDAVRREALIALKSRIDDLAHTRPDEAIALADAACARFDRTLDERTRAHRARAVARYFAGTAEDALDDFEVSLRGYEEAGDTLEAARIRRSLVEILLSLGRFDEALARAAEAREVFAEHGRGDLLAGLELNVGNVYFRTDDYGSARTYYELARKGFDEAGDDLGSAYASFSLANLEVAANEFERAAAGFEAARRIWEAHGQQGRVADCIYSLAFLDSRRGRFAEAVRGFERARTAYGEGSKPSGEAYVDLDLAEVYFRLGAWRDACDHAVRAGETFARLGLEYERVKSNAVLALSRLRLGDLDAGLASLRETIAAFEKLGNRTQVAVLALQHAGLRAARGEAEVVLPELRSMHAHLAASEQSLLVELATLALAGALNDTERFEEAERVLAPLVDRSDVITTSLVSADALVAHGIASRGRGDAAEARRAFERAIDETERSYSTVPRRDLRLAYFGTHRDAFCELVTELLRDPSQDAHREALSLLERSRMRSLAERASTRQGETAAEREARARVDRLLGEHLDAEIGAWSAHASARRPPSLEEIEGACDELARLVRGREASAMNRAPTIAADPQFVGAVAREGEAVVSFFEYRERLSALVVADGEVRVVALDPRELDEHRDYLAFQFERFRRTAEGARRTRSIRAATEAALDELGQALIEPLELACERIAFVPYGTLHGLPFHALRARGRFLVEDASVSLAPSLAHHRHAPVGERRAFLVACGDPSDSLPHVAAELDELARIYGDALVRKEPRALVADPSGELRGATALHLACHGTFRPTHPIFSGVRLGDSFLTAHDLRGLSLDLDLLTLSGCETGRVARVAGEDLSGLVQAFFSAGTRTIVGSLWPVADEETAELMGAFYRRLAGGEDARAALSRTQADWIAAGAMPFHWAAFYVTGDPSVSLSSA